MGVMPSSTAGLANFNPQEGHIIRKHSPEGRTYIYTFRKHGHLINKSPLFINGICFYCLILNANNI